MSEWLDRLVRDSRTELGTHEVRDVDWAAIDGALFRRIEAEQRAERAELAPRPGRLWAIVVAGLGVAGAAALMVTLGRTTSGTPALEGARGQAAAVEEVAGSVVAMEGSGQLRVNDKTAGIGTSLHRGDRVEARGVRVTVERPGKLTLVFEPGAGATVTHVQGALVLALEVGAVEAQVVPVPLGEAFAVDVGHLRVAAHGTHLRVARLGEHVVVDLSEGVVSLGDAPRTGSTLGALVTAPAHAEFTLGDPAETIAVTHDPGALHAPVAFVSSTPTRSVLPSVAMAPLPKATELPGGRFTANPFRIEGHAASAASSPSVLPAVLPAVSAGPPAVAAVPVVVVPPVPTLPAEVVIAAAVRACLAGRPRADNVTLMVSTTVHLALGSDGGVTSARFDPPVAPDVNACASRAIYETHFDHGGSVEIPVDLTLPSSAP